MLDPVRWWHYHSFMSSSLPVNCGQGCGGLAIPALLVTMKVASFRVVLHELSHSCTLTPRNILDCHVGGCHYDSSFPPLPLLIDKGLESTEGLSGLIISRQTWVPQPLSPSPTFSLQLHLPPALLQFTPVALSENSGSLCTLVRSPQATAAQCTLYCVW